MYHYVGWPRAPYAMQIAIDGGTLTVTGGQWPGSDVPIQSVQAALQDSDCYVFLNRTGVIVLTDTFLTYGWDALGNTNEMLDLLAWREGEEWHIKQLVPRGE